MIVSDEFLSAALRFYYDKSIKKSQPSLEAIRDAQNVLSALSKISVSELLANFKPTECIAMNSSSIPQFSSLDDCFNAIDKLVRSGLDGVTFEKIGFFLRTSQRNIGADRKYGENHIKCAELMGLCHINNGVWKNALSYAYEQLNDELKLALRPKFCLGVSMIREYFIQGQSRTYLQGVFSCLSESTRKRRIPNTMKIINTIKTDLS